MSDCENHPGDSHEQREAESIILEQLGKQLGFTLDLDRCVCNLRPDGFADGDMPVIVEIWAHQGQAKSAQKAKVMTDMCKLLLCERGLGKPCRKIVAVSDHESLAFLKGSWQGRFAKEFGVELKVVDIPEELRARIRAAQHRQYR